MLQGLLIVLSATLVILWHFPFIVLKPLGLHLYKVSSQQIIVMAMKKLSKQRSSMIEDDKPKGWIYGMFYLGYIMDVAAQGQRGSPTTVMYILATQKFYTSITEHSDGKKETKGLKIDTYDRTGNFFFLQYPKRTFIMPVHTPRENQRNEIAEIIKMYQQRTHCVVLLHGAPGAGKSTIPLLLAQELKASISDTFNPTDPGDNLSLLYNTVCPTKSNPLIVSCEEFDRTILNIHNEIRQHKDIPIAVRDKGTWNTFMDKIDRGMFPHLIMVLTSNKSPEFINGLDPSYIRKGRVDLICHIETC
jgi:hypothetical protein